MNKADEIYDMYVNRESEEDFDKRKSKSVQISFHAIYKVLEDILKS